MKKIAKELPELIAEIKAGRLTSLKQEQSKKKSQLVLLQASASRLAVGSA